MMNEYENASFHEPKGCVEFFMDADCQIIYLIEEHDKLAFIFIESSFNPRRLLV